MLQGFADLATDDVYPPSERLQTASGQGGAGDEGLETAGCCCVNGGESSWRFAPGTNKKFQ